MSAAIVCELIQKQCQKTSDRVILSLLRKATQSQTGLNIMISKPAWSWISLNEPIAQAYHVPFRVQCHIYISFNYVYCTSRPACKPVN